MLLLSYEGLLIMIKIQSLQKTLLTIHSMTCHKSIAYSTYPVAKILRAYDVRDMNTLIFQWPQHNNMV